MGSDRQIIIRRSWSAFLVTVALFVGLVRAAPPPISPDPVNYGKLAFRVFTDRDGLPQNSIESLAIDARGYLWACTRDGAAYYDGRTWQTVNLPHHEVSNWPRIVLATPDGSLWFGTEGAGLHRYLDGQWTTFNRTEGLPSNRVRALAMTTMGAVSTLWIGTDRGLASWRYGQCLPVRAPGGPGNVRINCLLATEEENTTESLWVGTASGELFHLQDGQWSTVHLPPAAAGRAVFSLLQTPASRQRESLWVGTQGGIGRLTAGTWTWYDETDGLPDSGISCLQASYNPDGHVSIWAGTAGSGLARYDGKHWILYGIHSGLPSNYIYTIITQGAEEGTRSLFVGTMTGLAHVEMGSWVAFDRGTGLPDHSVVSIMETQTSQQGDSLWIGTAGGGLARLSNGTWTVYDRQSGLGDNSAFCLLATEDDRHRPGLWVGTARGLAYLDTAGWKRYGPEAGLPAESVVCLLKTHSADTPPVMWIGTYGGGLARWQGNRHTLYTTANGLPDNRIEALLETPGPGGHTALWIATNGGLVRILNGQWQVMDHDSGLPNDVIRSLHLSHHADGSVTLWVGTGGGLAWMDPTRMTPQWHILTENTSPALPNNVIYRIEEDRLGRLYLCTNRGVVGVSVPSNHPNDASRFEFGLFTTADGLPSNECSFGASMIDHRGRLWVGTVRGAAVLDPTRNIPDRTPKPLYIERVIDSNTGQSLGSGASLTHSDNHLVFEYSLLSFFRGEDTRYCSQLEGLENHPSPWRPESRREFTSLSPGHYTFKLWGQDFAGNISGPVQFSFIISPSPWQTWWAYLLYFTFGFTLLAGGVRLRLTSLRRRNEELEILVARRTRELAAANRTLREMSVTDALTGLHNRRYLTLILGDEISQIRTAWSNRRAETPSLYPELVFFMIDLDLFKDVNDHYGHEIGDQVLVNISEVLRGTVREPDSLTRWGGEEFLVIARSIHRDEAPAVAERIRTSIENTPLVLENGERIVTTCSIGFAPFPLLASAPDRLNWKEVVAAADSCLYAAKRGGRNCWVGITATTTDAPDEFSRRIRADLTGLVLEGAVTVSSSRENARAMI